MRLGRVIIKWTEILDDGTVRDQEIGTSPELGARNITEVLSEIVRAMTGEYQDTTEFLDPPDVIRTSVTEYLAMSDEDRQKMTDHNNEAHARFSKYIDNLPYFIPNAATKENIQRNIIAAETQARMVRDFREIKSYFAKYPPTINNVNADKPVPDVVADYLLINK